jgi:heme/copper-type cytochrome/quinol oxidase subunit 2
MLSPRVVALAICAAGSLFPPAVASTSPPPQAAEPRTIEVVATRYAFEPAVIDAVQGEHLRILVKSGDGLHGFEIKKFKVSKEIPRGGEPVVIEFVASEPGQFPILCSVFCGDRHGEMKGTLVVTAGPAETP